MNDQSNPSPNRGNGRGAGGKFAKGNPGGPGNPHGRKVAQLRAALLRSVTASDVRSIAKALVTKAIEGDVGCAKLVLSYCLGSPSAVDILERLETLERTEVQS